MQAFGQAAAGHHAAGVFIDQDDFAALDDIVLVALVQGIGAQGLIDVVDQADVGRVIEILGVLGKVAGGLQHILDAFRAQLGQQGLALLLIQVIGGLVLDQLLHDPIDDLVQVGTVLGRARDDQRRTGLIDQDGVDLIDDGKVVAALDHFATVIDKVVAQVVETEFVIGAVGDVRLIGRLALALAQAVDDHADLKPQEAVDLAHGLGVASGQVVVDGDDVDALAQQGVQVDRGHGHQGLAFTGTHLGDAAFVQDHPAGHLNIVLTLTQDALGGFTRDGKGFDLKLVQFFACFDPITEGLRHHAQFVVGQSLEPGFEGIDLLHLGREGLDLAVVGRTKEFLGKAEHGRSGKGGRAAKGSNKKGRPDREMAGSSRPRQTARTGRKRRGRAGDRKPLDLGAGRT